MLAIASSCVAFLFFSGYPRRHPGGSLWAGCRGHLPSLGLHQTGAAAPGGENSIDRSPPGGHGSKRRNKNASMAQQTERVVGLSLGGISEKGQEACDQKEAEAEQTHASPRVYFDGQEDEFQNHPLYGHPQAMKDVEVREDDVGKPKRAVRWAPKRIPN